MNNNTYHIPIHHNQTLLDIAIQEYGNIKAVFDIATANHLNITDSVKAGTILNIPKSRYKNIGISNYYKNKQIKPASHGIAIQ